MKIKKFIKQKYHHLILNSEWYNREQFLDCKKFWDEIPMGLDIVNLGSSSAKYAFNYENQILKCANWAMEPQTLYADWLILQNYVSYLKTGASVLISICPFSSLSSPRLLTKSADRYYTFLAPESIQPFNVERYNKINDIKNNPQRYYPVNTLVHDLKRVLKGPYNDEDVSIPATQFEEHANSLINGWKAEFSIIDFKNPLRLHNMDIYKESIGILQEMITFCIERKLKPIIIIPPATSYITDKLSIEARDKYMYSFINSANTLHIPVLDYFEDERFQTDNLYRDSLSLNKKGAILFTKQVLNDLGLTNK